jgi:dTDP-alpha-D-glucose dehydrogenase
MKISIIGFGYIGAVIGAVYSNLGHEVFAIDNNKTAIDDLNSGICNVPEPQLQRLITDQVKNGNLKGLYDYTEIGSSDVILVTVGTPLSANFDADLTAISDVFRQLAEYVVPGQIIMLKSTVPPGVTRQMFDTFLNGIEDIYVGFSPERLAEGKAIQELAELPIIVGGVNEISTQKCSEFWESTLEVEVIKMSSPESAELVKLANNQWIDLNIALANELALLCDALPYPLDILEIIEGANSLKKGQHNVNILQPSIGVGGYCLTKDPWFVSALGDKNEIQLLLPKSGRTVNDNMPINAAKVVNNFFKSKNKTLEYEKIAILGYSFKTNSGDVRFSPMESFVKTMFINGAKKIHVFDSTINDGAINDDRVNKSQTWQECLSGASCVIYGAAHDDIKKITPSDLNEYMKDDKLIFDGRRYFTKDEIKELQNFGFSYKGVGRSI